MVSQQSILFHCKQLPTSHFRESVVWCNVIEQLLRLFIFEGRLTVECYLKFYRTSCHFFHKTLVSKTDCTCGSNTTSSSRCYGTVALLVRMPGHSIRQNWSIDFYYWGCRKNRRHEMDCYGSSWTVPEAYIHTEGSTWLTTGSLLHKQCWRLFRAASS
jgi:hypothetical protein